MGVIVTKGPAVVTKRQTVATPPIFGRSSSWMRSQIAVLDHDGEVEAIERQCCDVQQDPVAPHKAWARDFPLSMSVSGLNSERLLLQKTFATGWGGAQQGEVSEGT